MLKQWIRRRKLSSLSVDLNHLRIRNPLARGETGGFMASAEECYLAWRGHFETDAWRAEATGSMRAVSAIYFHWACDGAIERPAMDVQFDCLSGISSCYQYFMLREGEVLMRPYSCWCPACFNVSAEGPGKRTYLTCNFNVPYCTHAGNTLYSWRNKSCRAKTGAEASSPDKRARDRGHALAATGISPGQWVLVEAFGDNDDEMWLGKTVEFSDFGRQSCCKKHTEGQRNVYSVRFNSGDFMVAVQWYERLPENGDGERLEFFRGERVIDVINSTELRAVGVHVREIGLFPAEAGVNDPDALIKWELSRDDEAEALTWCR
jgi:hypothetical protein